MSVWVSKQLVCMQTVKLQTHTPQANNLDHGLGVVAPYKSPATSGLDESCRLSISERALSGDGWHVSSVDKCNARMSQSLRGSEGKRRLRQ